MGLIWGRRLEKKIGELIIVVSLLFSVSLAQAGKTSDAEIAVRKSGIALEQEAIKKVEPVFPPIAKAARASGGVKVEVTIDKAGKVISGKPAKVSGILTFKFVLDDGRKSEAEVERENLDPSEARLDRGTDLLKSYRYDEAIAEFREAIRLKPDNLFAHYKLGLAYVEAGRYAEGEATCEGALAITREKQPGEFDLSNLLTCLGEAKFRLGKDDEAINAFRRVAEMNPKAFDVHIRLAHSLIRKGANDEAISVLKECLTLEPKNANVPYILAGVYLIQGHLDEVITNLKSAIKLNPNFAQARFGLGMAYSAIGDKQAALKEYRAIKKLDPQLAQQLLSNINQ